jgi:hypothetical protein
VDVDHAIVAVDIDSHGEYEEEKYEYCRAEKE